MPHGNTIFDRSRPGFGSRFHPESSLSDLTLARPASKSARLSFCNFGKPASRILAWPLQQIVMLTSEAWAVPAKAYGRRGRNHNIGSYLMSFG